MGVFVNLSIGKVLPQVDLISPRVDEGSICAAELGPEMVAPENGPAETVYSLENPIEGVIFTYQYPSPYCPTTRIEVGRFGRFGRRMGSTVGRVGDSHVKVAGRPLRPVIHLEVLAWDDPMKYFGNPFLNLPIEDLAVEGVSSVYIVRREVNEYKGVWIRHGLSLFGC